MKKIIAACMSVLMMCCGVSASAYTAPAAYEQQEIADIAADLQAFLHKSGLDYYIYVYPNDVWGEEKVYVSFLSIDPETADQPDPVYIGEQETRQYLTDKGIDIDRCVSFAYAYAAGEPENEQQEMAKIYADLKAFIKESGLFGCVGVCINDVWEEGHVLVEFYYEDPEVPHQPNPVYIGERETLQYLTDKGIDIDRCIRFEYLYAENEPVYAVKGDFNNNGSVDAMDAQIVLDNALMQLMDADAAAIPGADLDGDGEVTPSDAQIVLNYYVMNSVISIPTDWADLI